MVFTRHPLVEVVHVTEMMPAATLAENVTGAVLPISVVLVSVSTTLLPSVAATMFPARTLAPFTTTYSTNTAFSVDNDVATVAVALLMVCVKLVARVAPNPLATPYVIGPLSAMLPEIPADPVNGNGLLLIVAPLRNSEPVI